MGRCRFAYIYMCYILFRVFFQKYRVFFLTGAPLKVLSVRSHSKSHQKSSLCQNYLSGWHLLWLPVCPDWCLKNLKAIHNSQESKSIWYLYQEGGHCDCLRVWQQHLSVTRLPHSRNFSSLARYCQISTLLELSVNIINLVFSYLHSPPNIWVTWC